MKPHDPAAPVLRNDPNKYATPQAEAERIKFVDAICPGATPGVVADSDSVMRRFIDALTSKSRVCLLAAACCVQS